MMHVADLEAEMIKRGMSFELIAWDRSIEGSLPQLLSHQTKKTARRRPSLVARSGW
jgi:hypothetical protein